VITAGGNVTATGFAPTTINVGAQRSAEDTLDAQLVARERAGWVAIEHKDLARLREIMAEEYHEIDMDGYRDKTAALKNIRNMKLSRYTMADVRVHRVATNVATIDYQGTLFGTFRGEPMSTSPFHYHVVYVNRAGVWHSVFAEEVVPR
jgi:hypothetical protein